PPPSRPKCFAIRGRADTLQPTPTSDGQCQGRGDVRDRLQAYALINAVDAVRVGSIAGSLGVLVEDVEPRICKSWSRVVAQLFASHLAVRGSYGSADRLTGGEDASIGHEALELGAEC